MAVNATNTNTAATGQWKTPPKFPTVGPADWSAPSDRRGSQAKPEPVYTDNFDFFRKMGWPSG